MSSAVISSKLYYDRSLLSRVFFTNPVASVNITCAGFNFQFIFNDVNNFDICRFILVFINSMEQEAVPPRVLLLIGNVNVLALYKNLKSVDLD